MRRGTGTDATGTGMYPPLTQETANLVVEAQAKRIAELEAENERLKVCGNCKHHVLFDDFFNQDAESGTYICDLSHKDDVKSWVESEGDDHCHYEHSRWVAREEGK